MKLSANTLVNVSNINDFEFSDQWEINEGSAHTLYFQLVDTHKEDLRYISQAAAISIDVTFLSIDDDSEIVIAAAQTFADDKSIWSVTLTAAQVPNAGAVKFAITEDAVVTHQFRVEQAITIDLLEAGSC